MAAALPFVEGAGLVVMQLALEAQTNAQPDPSCTEDSVGLINYLRFIAMECRAKPRTDLFEACALLHVTQSKSQEAYAEALMRCLNDALGKRAKLHAPGTPELSFDEAWLAQLGAATKRGDQASTNFLLASRIGLEDRRLVRFLVARISDFFSLG